LRSIINDSDEIKKISLVQPISTGNLCGNGNNILKIPIKKLTNLCSQLTDVINNILDNYHQEILSTIEQDIDDIIPKFIKFYQDYVKEQTGIDVSDIHPQMDSVEAFFGKVIKEHIPTTCFIPIPFSEFLEDENQFVGIDNLTEHQEMLDKLLFLYTINNEDDESLNEKNLSDFIKKFRTKDVIQMTKDLANEEDDLREFIANLTDLDLAKICIQRQEKIKAFTHQIATLLVNNQEVDEFPIATLKALPETEILYIYLKANPSVFRLNQLILAEFSDDFFEMVEEPAPIKNVAKPAPKILKSVDKESIEIKKTKTLSFWDLPSEPPIPHSESGDDLVSLADDKGEEENFLKYT
jgi:hypothetical protein